MDTQISAVKLNNNTFVNISYQQGYILKLVKYIYVLSNSQKWLQTEFSGNSFKNITSCYGNDGIKIIWILGSNLIDGYNDNIIKST